MCIRLVPPLTDDDRRRLELDELAAIKRRIAVSTLRGLRPELERALESDRPQDWRDALVLIVANLSP